MGIVHRKLDIYLVTLVFLLTLVSLWSFICSSITILSPLPDRYDCFHIQAWVSIKRTNPHHHYHGSKLMSVPIQHSICGITCVDPSCSHEHCGGWVRDLTEEGIEPNPGYECETCGYIHSDEKEICVQCGSRYHSAASAAVGPSSSSSSFPSDDLGLGASFGYYPPPATHFSSSSTSVPANHPVSSMAPPHAAADVSASSASALDYDSESEQLIQQAEQAVEQVTRIDEPIPASRPVVQEFWDAIACNCQNPHC